MTDVVESRNNIQQEEVSFESAVSEGTFFRLGAAINFINKRQFDTFEFKLNGPYFVASALVGADGILPIPYNCTIFGAAMYSITGGSSGQTTLDVHRYTSPGVDGGSIFSTRPSILAGAGDNAYVQNVDGTKYYEDANKTAPVISGGKIDLNAGDALRMDLDSSMASGQTCGLILFYRPR